MKTLKKLKVSKNAKFLAVFAVVLIVTSALVVGCPNPIKFIVDMDDSVSEAELVNVPEGMGAVRISFGNSTARTLLPNDDKTIYDFKRITILFERIPPNSPYDFYISGAEIDDNYYVTRDLLVPPGSYHLRVLGHEDFTPGAGAANKIVAFASSEDGGVIARNNSLSPLGFIIYPGQTTYLDITLRAIMSPYWDEGTLAFEIDLKPLVEFENGNLSLKDAVITATPYPDGTEPFRWRFLSKTKDYKGNVETKNSMDLPNGYYWVDILINSTYSDGGSIYDEPRGLRFRQFAHIYSNMTTPLKQTISPWMLSRGLEVGIPDNGPIWIDYVQLSDKIGYRYEAPPYTSFSLPYMDGGVIRYRTEYVKITITDGPDSNNLLTGTVIGWVSVDQVTGAETPLLITGNTVYVAKDASVDSDGKEPWVVPTGDTGIFTLGVTVESEGQPFRHDIKFRPEHWD